MYFGTFPRVRLGYFPTPISELKNLRNYLGKGPRIFVKRDDLTGVAGGGSKTRSLEYIIGHAIEQKCDTVITCGPVQSNHVRLTAAAARMCGIEPVLVLTGQKPSGIQGNLLLNNILHAKIIFSTEKLDNLDSVLKEVAAEEKSAGRKPYIINGGGYSPRGTIGYICLIAELLDQALDADIPLDYIILPSGTGCAQSGLILGTGLFSLDMKVLGVSINRNKNTLKDRIERDIEETTHLLGKKYVIPDESITIFDEYLGKAYGIADEACLEAVGLLGRIEGLILDPVYTGKSMAALLDLIRKGFFEKDDSVIFLHSGGTPGLFAKADAFSF